MPARVFHNLGFISIIFLFIFKFWILLPFFFINLNFIVKNFLNLVEQENTFKLVEEEVDKDDPGEIETGCRKVWPEYVTQGTGMDDVKNG